MDTDVVTRLEALVEELLGRLKALETERDRLNLECKTLLDDQQRIRAELDRILVKLEGWEQEIS